MNYNKQYLSISLNILVDLMRSRAELILQKEFKIDYSQFLVLHIINILDSPYQSDIANKISITNAGVSKIIDKLEASGLVTKVVDKKNRRSNFINLTLKGQNTINQALPLLELEFDKYINSEDKQTMSAMVSQVINKIK